MKTNSMRACCSIAALLIGLSPLCVSAKKAVNPFLKELPNATDDYGFTLRNPIKLGYSKNAKENSGHLDYYIESLRTDSGQTLSVLWHAARGVVDWYTLITENKADTVQLYFDLRNKATLKVPKGFLFLQATDSTEMK